MDTRTTTFEAHAGRTRHDTVACGTVLVTMLLGALYGALLF
jgi:hypothetical protein